MKEALYGELSIIGMNGCEQFVSQVDYYLKEWRRHGGEESFLVDVVSHLMTAALYSSEKKGAS